VTSARAWVASLAIVLAAAACGDGTAATSSPAPSPAQSPTPPAGIPFKLNPEPGVTATGTIVVTPGATGTTIEVEVTGLQATSRHVSHIHIGGCEERGSIAFALNPVIADGQGTADTRSTITQKYPPPSGHWYVVVHAGPDMQGSNANYLLCGNLF
jgi:hypothetical protein